MMLGLPRATRGFDPDSSILPLINIVFLLLVFFMLAGRMTAVDPLAVDPPHSDSREYSGEGGVRIAVAADGRTAMDGETLSRDTILERIGMRVDATPELRVRLKADARADSREIVLFMERLQAAGVEHVQLVTVARP